MVYQVLSEFCCINYVLEAYLDHVQMLLSHFDNVSIKYVPRQDNGKANYLALLAFEIA